MFFKNIFLRSALLLVIFAGSVAVAIYPRFCLITNICGPASVLPFSISFFATTALAADEGGLKVISLAVDSSRSSFRRTKDNLSIHAVEEDAVRIGVEYDREMLDALQHATCSDVKGDQPILDVLPIWRDILHRRGQDDIAGKLSSLDGYRNLLLHGGAGAFDGARPNAAEFMALSKSDPGQFAIMMRWAAKCIGMSDPVIIWTLKNSLSSDVTLTRVDYDVLDIGQVKGGGPDVLEPVDVEPHDLYHKIGIQLRELEPKVVVHSGGTVMIRVRYRLQTDEPGLTWLVKPTFQSVEGVSATADAFKIFGAKFVSHK
jgi:hypothetical protein